LASYAERVAFVDNKVIYEIEEIEKPEEVKQIQKEAREKRKKEKEVVVEKPKVEKQREDDNKKSVLDKRREKASVLPDTNSKEKRKTTERLREMVTEQQNAFEKLRSSPFNPYEKMGINEDELRNSLVETEKNINNAMRSSDMLDNDDEMDDDYQDLVAQQTITSIGMSTSYPSKKNKLTSREENEQYINNIVESILIDGIDDED
jgi:hypothetical protein